MVHRPLSLLATLIVVAVSFCSSYAQQANSKDDRAAQREKAYQLLESLAGQIPSLRSAENRARLGSNIAESLWDRDEKRARSLFASVEDDIQAGFAQAQSGEVEDELSRMVFVHLRMDTIKRMAKHDPKLALDFMKSTQSASDTKASYTFAQLEHNLEMDLAKSAAANSPEITLTIGRRELEKGHSYELRILLSTLLRKHRSEGAVLYHETVLALRDSDMSNSDTADFAIGLAQAASPPAVEETDFRELINMLIALASSRGCTKLDELDPESGICDRIGTIVPQLEKVDAARAGEFRRWYKGPESIWSNEGYEEFAEIARSGSVDDLVAFASKYPQLEQEAYLAAISKAQAEGDSERARKIAEQYRGNPETLEMLRAYANRAQRFAEKKDEILQNIQKELDANRNARDQISILMVAGSEIGLFDQKTGLKLLDQANDILHSMKAGRDQTQIEVALAAIYCQQKSDRGLAMMESLLPRINTLVAAAVELDGYDTHYLRDGEWNMASGDGIGRLLTGLSENARYFAWCDFDRALSSAGQFERTEIRLMAQMKLAQAIIAGPPKGRFFGQAW